MSESMLEINKWGTKFWKNSKGQLHRTDGPAVKWEGGNEEWFMNGKRHRQNGPAIVLSSGDKFWYVNGKGLGKNEEGFWRLWDRLTPEQKQDPVLLSYLPEKF
jgi:hypothetical protein